MGTCFSKECKERLTKSETNFTFIGGFTIKNNIKILRAQRSMTQDQLAEKLSVSRQTIIALEKEKYNPSITLAFKLAEIFNCKIEDIFIYEGDFE